MLFEGVYSLNAISARVSQISLQIEDTQCKPYQRSMDAEEAILAARDRDGDERRALLKYAISALDDCWGAIPEDLEAEWQDSIDALQEMVDDA